MLGPVGAQAGAWVGLSPFKTVISEIAPTSAGSPADPKQSVGVVGLLVALIVIALSALLCTLFSS